MKKRLRKIQPQFQNELDNVVYELCSLYPEKVSLRGLKWFITDTYRGRAYCDGQFTVPLWAYKKGKNYFTYYTAHELAHHITFKKFGKQHCHSPKFYYVFTRLCPKHLQHFELKYKKRAVLYGVKNNKK